MSLRYGNDSLLWACWLYYEEGLNQGEVAQKMGVSRASVNTYLADAKAKGIVDITIHIDQLQTLSIAKALKDHFGLQECLVIPTEGADGSLIDRLGRAGALALEHVLQSGDRIAVGWGRTLFSVGKALDASTLQDIHVVQGIGSVGVNQDYTPEACAHLFAQALHARCTQISAPAIVSSRGMRETMQLEPLISGQLSNYDLVNRAVFGVSSLRPQSTLHTSGFFDDPLLQKDHYAKAVGAIFGQFIDDRGRPVHGPLDDRMFGMSLEQVLTADQRIAIAGGFDKVPAILATLRGGYANVLVTDMATGRGILTADGQNFDARKVAAAPRGEEPAPIVRTKVKKLVNAPADAVNEALEGIVAEHADYIRPIDKSHRALQTTTAPTPGKVGLVIGGGSGHEPSFYGFVGAGLADAVAIGNIFASPPPGPVLECTIAADQGAGVLHVFGNYSGDIMNFGMAAEMAKAKGIDVRTIITTDDIASSAAEDHEGRRGVAGNIFTFKIAGAACAKMLTLDACETIVRKANARTYTVGIATESCSLPETGRPSFFIGEDEVEFGVGIHGEPGVERRQFGRADEMTDLMVDKILAEMNPDTGDRVGLLVNSLGGTPLMELYIVNRRVRQRLNARGIAVHASWTGSYCTSLDMVGVSVSMLHLDDQLTPLLDAPCDAAMFRVG